MLLVKRHPRQILALSILYSVLFAAILLSFPKKGGDGVQDVSFFSAPKSSSENIKNLPIRITRGSSAPSKKNVTNNTIAPTIANTQTKNNQPVQTCANIGICDKIHFSDGYSAKQKAAYYKAIIEIIGGISSHLPQENAIQDTLYSLTLSAGTGERRGRGGSQTILIYTQDINSLQEFREILTHELGHIIDLGVIKGIVGVLDTSFTLGGKNQFGRDDPSLQFYRFSRSNTQTRIADISYIDFVGGYAMTSPYEDFAESFNLYLWHHDVFAAMAESSPMLQKKYDYINTLMQGFYFEKDSAGLARFLQNNKQRPWDTTRMSLE